PRCVAVPERSSTGIVRAAARSLAHLDAEHTAKQFVLARLSTSTVLSVAATTATDVMAAYLHTPETISFRPLVTPWPFEPLLRSNDHRRSPARTADALIDVGREVAPATSSWHDQSDAFG